MGLGGPEPFRVGQAAGGRTQPLAQADRGHPGAVFWVGLILEEHMIMGLYVKTEYPYNYEK